MGGIEEKKEKLGLIMQIVVFLVDIYERLRGVKNKKPGGPDGKGPGDK